MGSRPLQTEYMGEKDHSYQRLLNIDETVAVARAQLHQDTLPLAPSPLQSQALYYQLQRAEYEEPDICGRGGTTRQDERASTSSSI